MSDLPQFDADGIGGHSSILFPATSGLGTAALAWGTGPLTFAGLVRLAAAPTVAETIINGQNTSSGAQPFWLARNSTGSGYLMRRGGSNTAFSHASAAGGAPHALVAIFNGASSKLYVDGVEVMMDAAGTNPGTGAVTAFKLGVRDAQASGGTTSPLNNGRIGSPMVISGAIDAATVANVTGYLLARAA